MSLSLGCRAVASLIIGLTAVGCAGGSAERYWAPGQVGEFSNADWQFVLDAVVVEDGYAVRWEELQANVGGSRDALRRYIDLLGAASPDNRADLFPTDADRLAYWINAYNVICMHRVLERDLPADLIAGTATPTPGSIYRVDATPVGGRRLTLDDIEQSKVRASGDPRIHFALNCASYSCPPLRHEPYTGAALDAQLADQGRKYLSNPRAVDRVGESIRLNALFLDFYRIDFLAAAGRGTGTDADVAAALQTFAAPDSPVQRPSTEIGNMGYDWSLNRAK